MSVVVFVILCFGCVRRTAETPAGMNFVDEQMARRMASRTLEEFEECTEVSI